MLNFVWQISILLLLAGWIVFNHVSSTWGVPATVANSINRVVGFLMIGYVVAFLWLGRGRMSRVSSTAAISIVVVAWMVRTLPHKFVALPILLYCALSALKVTGAVRFDSLALKYQPLQVLTYDSWELLLSIAWLACLVPFVFHQSSSGGGEQTKTVVSPEKSN